MIWLILGVLIFSGFMAWYLPYLPGDMVVHRCSCPQCLRSDTANKLTGPR